MLLAALLVVAAPHALRGQAPSPATLRHDGDQHYGEESYALALDDYQKWLTQAPTTAPDRALIEYRVAVALGKAQKWDDALAAWDAFLTAHKADPYWVARAQYQRGLLLANCPTSGVQGRRQDLSRQRLSPHGVLRDAGICHISGQDDAKAELAAFEASALAFQQLPPKCAVQSRTRRRTCRSTSPKSCPAFSRGGRKTTGRPPTRPIGPLMPPPPMTRPGRRPKRFCFCWPASRASTTDPHADVLAEMARGLYVAQSHNGWARWDYNAAQTKYEIVQTIPYYKLDPIDILTRLADAVA